MKIVGFWIDNGEPAEVTGKSPSAMELGSANITWIIRRDSEQARDEGHKAVFGVEG